MKWPLLDVLTDEQAREVLRIARRRKFARAQTVFHEGDPGETLHLVDKGKVAIRVTTPLGDTATLRILAAGDFFGEIAVSVGSVARRPAPSGSVDRTHRPPGGRACSVAMLAHGEVPLSCRPRSWAREPANW